MEIVGRLTQDAKLNVLKDERKVVNFSVAVNDRYKPKDKEAVKLTTYFNCSYWVNPNISEFLKKGTLVELYGRVGVNAWTDMEGKAKASLTFYVTSIKLHGSSNGNRTQNAANVTEHTKEEAEEPLPF